MKELQSAIKAIGYTKLGKAFDNERSYDIACALYSFRHLFDNLLLYESVLLKDMFGSQGTDKIVFPCDIIELRDILADSRISVSCNQVPMFSMKFSEQYLNDYSIHLVLSRSKINAECEELGSMYLYESPRLDFDNAVIGIGVSGTVGKKAIADAKRIADELCPSCAFYVMNQVPGISAPTAGI